MPVLFYRKDWIVEWVVSQYPAALKHLRDTHRKQASDRTRAPALSPPVQPRNAKRPFQARRLCMS